MELDVSAHDDEWFALIVEESTVRSTLARWLDVLGTPTTRTSTLNLAETNVSDLRSRLDEIVSRLGEMDSIFASRGGWSRFWLVPDGHIHSSRECSTCFPTTKLSLLAPMSGKTSKEAVKEHGPLLCSVCFPDAPVEWATGPAKAVSPDRCDGALRRRFDYEAATTRIGYVSGNSAVCTLCGNKVTLTRSNSLRTHDR